MSEDPKDLRAAFEDWLDGLASGDLERFWGYAHERAEFLDEDYPWRLDKQEFIDHIDFHVSGGGQGLWEFFQWLPRELNFTVIGTTGHVSGYSTFRGKPRDAGFRQRFMGFTQTWVNAEGGWKLLCWHQSVLAGRIDGASPS